MNVTSANTTSQKFGAGKMLFTAHRVTNKHTEKQKKTIKYYYNVK